MKYFTMLLISASFCNCSSANLENRTNPFTVNLWELNESISLKPERFLPSLEDSIIRITDVNIPSLTVFHAKESGQKPVVLVFPGGGYSILAYDLEGKEVASWLNSIGITAIVVKYTVPNDREAAFRDGQKAIQLTREHANEWNIDSNKIGVLGFSAGAHLSARLSSVIPFELTDSFAYENLAPDFTVLIYPAYLDDPNSNKLAPEIGTHESIPPILLIQTKDDTNFVNGTILYNIALEESGADVTFHLFENGGHGYGLRADESIEVSKWPKLVEKWLIDQGIIKSLSK